MFKRANRVFRRLLGLSTADQVFLFRAAVKLWRVRRRLISSGVRDFRRLNPRPPEKYGKQTDDLASERCLVAGSTVADQTTRASVQRTSRLVMGARFLLPGGATCLELALAVQELLAAQHIPSNVRIGVRKNGDLFEAHAWLESFGSVVVGGDDVYRQYAVMSSWKQPC